MNGWLLDTNVVAELANPHATARVLTWVAAQDEALPFLSILILGEYDEGLHNLPPDSPHRPPIAAAIGALDVRLADRVLPLSDAIVPRWGSVRGAVKRQTGQPPPVIDILLAATAIEHDLCLLTRNVRDARHSGAMPLNPREDAPNRYVPQPSSASLNAPWRTSKPSPILAVCRLPDPMFLTRNLERDASGLDANRATVVAPQRGVTTTSHAGWFGPRQCQRRLLTAGSIRRIGCTRIESSAW